MSVSLLLIPFRVGRVGCTPREKTMHVFGYVVIVAAVLCVAMAMGIVCWACLDGID